ncbi:OmpA family protein [Metapseudomonas resinovorans]|uniref:Putative outer membrane protein n=1 Tax=Metapseudomonas resinovorans NBRC 106553 TaxID=1245471 RepID=S6ADI9_METRE|nr:OmpA family protein [Pseudomonas resinovorans]BAN47322.1 putative outer membrane protein [Pseudomonas resinovorans NBRC 106553]
MSITRIALPLVLLVSSLLAGCSGLQKTDWPKCAAVGGVVGAGLGAIESSTYAGWGALIGAGTAAAYCWVHGDGDEDGDGVPDSRDKCPGTPRGTPVDADGCPIKEEVVEEVVVVEHETIVVRDLLFAFDSSKLNEASQANLDTVASRLKNEAPNAKLSITGHTDSVGTEEYNQGLSERRAQAVADYLVRSGIPAANIVSVTGAGELQPIADNATKDGRAMNRRVEIQIDR